MVAKKTEAAKGAAPARAGQVASMNSPPIANSQSFGNCSENMVLAQFTRSVEVLLWIARGKSNRDIAKILDLSPRTVNKHLEQIYAKLGVENRASAAALAVRTIGVR
jgi:DNA-binding CsgD family transcriptional regulator